MDATAFEDMVKADDPLVYDPMDAEVPSRNYTERQLFHRCRLRLWANSITFMAVEEMLQTCDFISLHMLLTEETRYIINSNRLQIQN